MLIIAIGSFLSLLLIGVPVAIALGLASFLAIALASPLPLVVVVQAMVGQLDSFALLAVPFFVFVGELMERGGIAHRLVTVADRLVGHLRGGLAQVTVVTSMLFAGISGSSAADASAVGSVLIPSMQKRGYPAPFAAAVTAAAATIGPIIPPSTLAIIFGSIAGVSIGKLFLAGVVPGLLMGIGLMTVVAYMAPGINVPLSPRSSFAGLVRAIYLAKWALLVPLIIVGGILSGMFTPTESGAVTAFYALVVAMLVERSVGFRDLAAILVKTGKTTSLVMLVIATAGSFSWILAAEGVPILVRDAVLSVSDNATVVLFIILAFMLLLGCVLEIVAASIVMIPVLYPIAQSFGYGDVHFGLLIMLTMAIGAVTPPVGVTTYIALGISGAKLGPTTVVLWPFVAVLVLVTALIALYPPIATFLPDLFLK